MTSTTETETKVETAPPKEDVKDQAVAGNEATEKAPTSTPASPTKTGTLKKEPVILAHKKDFEKDVVYLYQFVRSPTTPSLSVECLKVETWLRINGIRYENVDHKMRYKSKKGNLPFIEMNGEEFEDVDCIIREVAAYFDKTIDDGLTNDQKMISHAFESMLNNHTGWIVRWWRYNNPQEFLQGAQLDIKRTLNSRFPNSILNFVFKIGYKKPLIDAVGYTSGRYDPEEVYGTAKKDLKALSDLLGSNDYFFGKEPHNLDSTAFAHLVQYLCVPFGGIKEWMEAEAPNLLSFVDRVKARVWTDWESMVSTLDMNTHLPKKEPAEGEVAATPGAGGDSGATDAAEKAKKDAEAKKAEKKRLAEEKKKEREEKKKKEKEEKERIKKEKEEAAKAKKAAEAEAKAKAAEEAKAKAEAEAAEKAKAEEAKAAADAEKKPEEATKEPEATANGGDAPKTEVTAE